jgi:hypothetical protein
MLPSSGPIKFSDIRSELGLVGQVGTFYLGLAESGDYISLNECSTAKPNRTDGISLVSEWYGYNHTQACPPPPSGGSANYIGHFYPCDGQCNSTGDIIVECPNEFIPIYGNKFYRINYQGQWGAIKFYADSLDPADTTLTNFNLYNSCQNACNQIPNIANIYQNTYGGTITFNYTDSNGNPYYNQTINANETVCAQIDSISIIGNGSFLNLYIQCTS